MSAVGITAFVLLMAAVPVDFIEKFGFHLGLGVGVGFLAAGTKALRNKYRNLGVLIVYCALAMIAVAGLATPKASWQPVPSTTFQQPLLAPWWVSSPAWKTMTTRRSAPPVLTGKSR